MPRIRAFRSLACRTFRNTVMRFRTPALLFSALLIVALFLRCENSFTPKSPFHPQLAVFCVLNGDDAMQVVRIAKSYDAVVSSVPVPLTSAEIDSAIVSVRDSKRLYPFKDTLVGASGGGTLRVWISRGFHPQPGQTYTLSVRVPGFEAVSAAAMLPGKLYPSLKYEKPDTGLARVRVMPGFDDPRNVPYGYLYRMWVVLTRNDGGAPDQTRAEVPANFNAASGEMTWPVPGKDAEVVFPVPTIQYTYNLLRGSDTTFVKKELVIEAFALDESFYRYYKIAQGFEDPLTLRIDKPNLTFIPGGLGVFGTVNLDSMRFNYSTYVK